MTQELIDLRNRILQQRYTEALAIVDDLEGMSRQGILRNIQSFLKILLIHLIKIQVEQRITNSWAASIRNSLIEIKKLNLKENKKSYYINLNEWDTYIEDEIEVAIRDASMEVLDGIYNEFQITEVVERNQVISICLEVLALTYSYSVKELPAVIADFLTQLPGGNDWKLGKK
ncbi:DUF29 family protein [Cronbergia sp. UHCC 0137]|uniref:DUF29 family protein n=1 Tax=Cronbergia sp. UHCC 0137 TaxID=3110239 RepID=UPI002B1FEE25|nr:DUF29 family protein [Cronbergia sp. UHCC 0137]MEA5620096.1 DUF29 family protein [Cronbergia sp. UHCC 0137]